MAVYLRGTVYYYDFVFNGRRYHASTRQQQKDDAEQVEANLKRELRQEAGGIAVFNPARTPRFQDWAEVYLEYQQQFTDRPDLIERALVVVLEFWGAPPSTPRKAPAVARTRRVAAPYHDLRLGDPIADPDWILKFDRWVEARGVSASTRNTYLSALSGMYRVALQPQYRKHARVPSNPFRDIRRGSQRSRLVALSPQQVLDWVHAASYHVALAVTIAALAPKLRLQTILGLKWNEHFDKDLTRITVSRHKTSRRTGLPQVTPISAQLRAVLEDARSRSTHPSVINYHDKAVASIKVGAKRAAESIGLTWGIEGVTFHTLRHSIATLLATLGMPERIRMEIMGHAEIRTTQQYTHLAAQTQIEPHEQLAQALPVQDILLNKPRRKAAGEKRGKTGSGGAKTGQNSADVQRALRVADQRKRHIS